MKSASPGSGRQEGQDGRGAAEDRPHGMGNRTRRRAMECVLCALALGKLKEGRK